MKFNNSECIELRQYLGLRVSNVVNGSRRRVTLFPEYLSAEVPSHVTAVGLAAYLLDPSTTPAAVRLRPLHPMTIGLYTHAKTELRVRDFLTERHDDVGLAGRQVQLQAIDDASDNEIIVYTNGDIGRAYSGVHNNDRLRILLLAISRNVIRQDLQASEI